MEFHGVKIAVLIKGKLLMHLRDDKPGLFMANMWDFPGGGREINESPEECAVREVKEEFGIDLPTSSIIWQGVYKAQKDPCQNAIFLVAEINNVETSSIALTEGQKWELFDQETFFQKTDVIESLKVRFRDYLNSKSSNLVLDGQSTRATHEDR
jgi:8-oxo-dGTP diphosphatase